MNITDLFHVIKISHISGVPLYIHGLQGFGKSSSVKHYVKNSFHFYKTEYIDSTITDDQYNKLNDDQKSQYHGFINYGYVDYRIAQMEISDISGLPDRDIESKRTIYYTPEKLPVGKWINEDGKICDEPEKDYKKWTKYKGILFIDEINRGQDDVLNAIFELIYDRSLHSYKLPDGWGIIAAGNPSNSSFSVNSFIDDDAFKDRFCHIFLEFDDKYKNSWINYMLDVNVQESIIHKITNFCMLDDAHLCDDSYENDFVVKPSPRSWEFVARIENAISQYPVNDDMRFYLLKGLIGDIASYYIEHSIDIYPGDIIKYGVNKYINILKKYNRNQIQSLSWTLARQAKKLQNIKSKKSESLPENIMNNVISYGKWMMTYGEDYRDLAVAFFDILLQSELKDITRKISFTNESLKKLLKENISSVWYKMIIKDPDLDKLIKRLHGGKL